MNKPTPQQLNEYLKTHCPNNKERRILEARYKKQQRDIKKGKRKVNKVTIKRLTWWRKILNFIMRKS